MLLSKLNSHKHPVTLYVQIKVNPWRLILTSSSDCFFLSLFTPLPHR